MTPEEYDCAEREALRRVPNRVIEASRTMAFDYVGYPTKIYHEDELWRYADVMQEGRTKSTFELINGFTAHEFELFKRVTDKVRRLVGVTPYGSLMRAVPVYRAIKASGAQSVLELGAGSGYVGALLQADGLQYWCTDICQAFAVWQIKLLGKDAFVPWWDWMGTWAVEGVEAVTANHMLNEMHVNGLVHAAKRIKEMLKPPGKLWVEDLGSNAIRNNQDTLGILELHGVKPAMIYAHEVKLDKPDVTWDQVCDFWGRGTLILSEDEKFRVFLNPK